MARYGFSLIESEGVVVDHVSLLFSSPVTAIQMQSGKLFVARTSKYTT
jgi:hypothetical protein